MTIGPTEQEIIVKIFDTLITAGLAYIAKVFWNVVQSVTSIPKMKQDLDLYYQKLRAVEKKLSMDKEEKNNSPDGAK